MVAPLRGSRGICARGFSLCHCASDAVYRFGELSKVIPRTLVVYFFSRSRYPIQLRIPPSTRMITAPIIGPALLAKMASPIPYILLGNKRLRAQIGRAHV